LYVTLNLVYYFKSFDLIILFIVFTGPNPQGNQASIPLEVNIAHQECDASLLDSMLPCKPQCIYVITS